MKQYSVSVGPVQPRASVHIDLRKLLPVRRSCFVSSDSENEENEDISLSESVASSTKDLQERLI